VVIPIPVTLCLIQLPELVPRNLKENPENPVFLGAGINNIAFTGTVDAFLVKGKPVSRKTKPG
jgi:hypothetical protein